MGIRGWLTLSVAWLCGASVGWAQPPWQSLISPVQIAQDAPQPKPGDPWLGLLVAKVPAEVRAQIDLPEGRGVIVAQVVPEGPSAKAGVKPNDVLVKAGDRALAEPADLLKALESAKAKELALEVLRGGKSMKILVKPQPRPAADAPAPGPQGFDAEAVKKWLEQMAPDGRGGPLRFRFYHPGAILPPGAPVAPLPGDMSVSIQKQGSEPARITVTRGKEKWEVTEKELEKLPADVRPHVERMLGRGPLAFRGGDSPTFDFIPAPHKPAPDDRSLGALGRRLDQVERQLNQVRKQLEEIRDRK